MALTTCSASGPGVALVDFLRVSSFGQDTGGSKGVRKAKARTNEVRDIKCKKTKSSVHEGTFEQSCKVCVSLQGGSRISSCKWREVIVK